MSDPIFSDAIGPSIVEAVKFLLGQASQFLSSRRQKLAESASSTQVEGDAEPVRELEAASLLLREVSTESHPDPSNLANALIRLREALDRALGGRLQIDGLPRDREALVTILEHEIVAHDGIIIGRVSSDYTAPRASVKITATEVNGIVVGAMDGPPDMIRHVIGSRSNDSNSSDRQEELRE